MQTLSHIQHQVDTRQTGFAHATATKPSVAADAEYTRRVLMAHAARPEYGVSIALAGVLANSWARRGWGRQPLFGIDTGSTYRMLSEHFPGAGLHLPCAWSELGTPAEFEEALELADLVDMLVENRTVEDEDSRLLAHAMATACLGDNHLWQDMLLPARSLLSDLFYGFFNSLAVRNRQDMKWKKFLYKQLCERAEIRICKAPSCGVCTDYTVCFGSEV